MIKLLGVFVAGMFVGAVCVEVLARTKPELVGAISGKAEGLVDMFGGSMPDINERGSVSC